MISLFNKYRPQRFGEIIGQKTAVEVMTNSITRGTVNHAYLFSGSRGCGKTSAARIFAKALNCLNRRGYEPCCECANCRGITTGESLDVLEIDGASNNGVENIRGLKENVTLKPFNSRWKIYIIDEVHMLSTGAFNALLKTLEEPPEHVIFIMATTEPQKVPVTIRSRCLHIPFQSISPDDIYGRLKEVCEREGVNAESEALREIARQADGALRDALSLLEQVIASGEDVKLGDVERIIGAGSRTAFEKWLSEFRKSPSEGYITLKSMFASGASGVRIFEEMFSLVRNLWLISRWHDIAEKLGMTEHEREFMNQEVTNWKPEELQEFLKVIVRILSEARRGVKPDILLGMFMFYFEGNNDVSDSEPQPTERKIPVNDENLKARLLDKSFKENFLIHCWLYSTEVREQNGKLMIEVKEKYNWEYIKIDRNSAQLCEVFAEYEEVKVKYENDTITCRKLLKEEEEKTAPIEPEREPEVRRVTKLEEFISELRKLGGKPEELLKVEKSEEDHTDEGESEE